MQLYTDSWTVASDLAGWLGTWNEHIKKLVTRKFGERYVDRPLNGQKT